MKNLRTFILTALLTGDSSTPPPPRGWTRARALRLQSAPRRWGGRRGRGTRGFEPRPSWAARGTCTTTTAGAGTPSRGPSLLSRYCYIMLYCLDCYTVSISGLEPGSPPPQPWQSKIVAGNKVYRLYSQRLFYWGWGCLDHDQISIL